MDNMEQLKRRCTQFFEGLITGHELAGEFIKFFGKIYETGDMQNENEELIAIAKMLTQG